MQALNCAAGIFCPQITFITIAPLSDPQQRARILHLSQTVRYPSASVNGCAFMMCFMILAPFPFWYQPPPLVLQSSWTLHFAIRHEWVLFRFIRGAISKCIFMVNNLMGQQSTDIGRNVQGQFTLGWCITKLQGHKAAAADGIMNEFHQVWWERRDRNHGTTVQLGLWKTCTRRVAGGKGWL